MSSLPTDDSPLKVVGKSRGVDNLDALTKPDHVGRLPPLIAVTARMLRFTLVNGALVVCVDETTQTSAVAADDHDGLADPAADVLDVAAIGAAEGVDDVYKVG